MPMLVHLLETSSLLRKYLDGKPIHPRDYFELRLLEEEGYVTITKEEKKPAFCYVTEKGENIFHDPEVVKIAKKSWNKKGNENNNS